MYRESEWRATNRYSHQHLIKDNLGYPLWELARRHTIEQLTTLYPKIPHTKKNIMQSMDDLQFEYNIESTGCLK